jgi:extradiol dioxygenase family protein
MALSPFHLAIPVNDLEAARHFYGALLGCSAGRSSEHWADYDFFGHQLVCHETGAVVTDLRTNLVDGEAVPVPHFGVVLDWQDWEALAERLRSFKVKFLIETTIRFVGKPGEQATMFLADPSGNMLEFKAMRDPDRLFAV